MTGCRGVVCDPPNTMECRSSIRIAAAALLVGLVLAAAGQILAGEREDALALHDKGLQYYSAARYHDAIMCYERALAICRKLGHRRGEGACLRGLGLAYCSLGDYSKAIDYETVALAISQQIGDRRGEGACLGNLGIAYGNLGDCYKAIEYHTKALAIDREIGDKQGEGADFNSLGLLYSELGDYHKAIEYHTLAVAIAEVIGDKRTKGKALGNLGLAYGNLGDYYKAIEYHTKALAIDREIGDRQGEGANLNNLGFVYHNLGDYRKAVEFYTKALGIAEQIGDKRNQSGRLGNLGGAYYSLGDYRKAIEYHTKALAIAEEIHDKRGKGNQLLNLGNAYKNLGDHPKALEFYEKSLVVYKQTGIPTGLQERNIADVYLAMDRDDEAFVIYRKLDNPIRLGLYYLKKRDWQEARSQFTRDQKRYEERRQAQFILASYMGEGLACENLGEFKAGRAAFQNAVDLLERQRDALTQEQRARFLAGADFSIPRIEPYEGLVRSSFKLKKAGEAFYWAENTRARVLAERLAAKEAEARELRIPKKLAEEEEETALKLRENLKAQDAAFKADNQELLTRLEAEYPELKKRQQEFIDRLRRDHPEYAAVHYPKPVKVDQVPLTSNEVLIEFEVTDPGTVAFVVYGGKVQKAFMIEKTRAELEALVNEFRAPFEAGHEFEESDNALAKQLYDLLLKKALTGIQPSRKLIIVPDECLSLLPFEALVMDLKARKAKPSSKVAQKVKTRGLVSKKEIIEALQKRPVRTRGLSVQLPRIGIPIEFDTNSAKISQKAEPQMKEIVAALASPKLKDAQFRFEGHTDSVGDEDYNLTLSRRRAGSVVDYVVEKARLKKDRLFTEGLGESRPVASNETDEGRQRNRRVEIVRLPGPLAETAATQKANWKMPEDVVYLIDRYPSISYYQAATVLANNRELKKPRVNKFDLFAVADPIFGGDDARTSKLAQRSADRAAKGLLVTSKEIMDTAKDQGQTYCFDRLACTAQEVQEVASLFPKGKTRTLLGGEADEASLKGMKLDKYHYVLFSTHGILGDELPYIREPALVLNLVGNEDEDGFLKMSEIMNLRLNADLVCLSACQTGLGTQQAGEGVMGLTRAFMYAGCDSLLVSLWSVADVSSALLMTEFFKGLKAGKDKSEALHDAKTHLRKNGYDHPFFWAPFVLMGER